MRIDPVSLKLFLAVLELGTIAAAAEREHIAASAVSKRISDLEDVLRTPLIQRSNKGIGPTPAGVALQNLARGIVNDLENIYVYMRDYSSGTRGLVRLFANVSAIAEFLPSDLRTFVESYPLVQLQLEERVTGATLRGVAENAADIGIFSDSGVEPEGLVTLPYREDEHVAVLPAMHPFVERPSLAATDLLDQHLIGLMNGSYLHIQLVRLSGQLGIPVKFRVQVNSYDAVCLMVEANIGIGVIPLRLATRYAKVMDIRLVPLEDAWARRKLNICLRSYESLPMAARLLVDHLRTVAASFPT